MIPLEQIDVLLWPFLACLVLVGIHGYLGIHVLSRKVIFVDLAMAQIAALGGTVAFLLGHDPRSSASYFMSLSFTLGGSAVFAMTRTKREAIPQEAVIGLVYAIASAAAVLLADLSPHGGEHLKEILAGSIVWVSWKQVLKIAAIYAAVGAFHWWNRDKFLRISLDPQAAAAEGINVRLWDFLFYLSFGLVITSSVAVAGVLLVFCYLIAPAVAACLFAESIRSRLLFAWISGTIVSAIGLLFSWNRPSGPMIICSFAAFLALAAVGRAVSGATSRRRALAVVTGGLALLLVGAWALVNFGRSADHDHHANAEDPLAGNTSALVQALLGDSRSQVREEAARRLGQRKDIGAAPALSSGLGDREDCVKEECAKALLALGAHDSVPALLKMAAVAQDEWVRLEGASAAAGLGSREGVDAALRLATDGEARQVRIEAVQRLRKLLPHAGAAEGEAGAASLRAWWTTHGKDAVFDASPGIWVAR